MRASWKKALSLLLAVALLLSLAACVVQGDDADDSTTRRKTDKTTSNKTTDPDADLTDPDADPTDPEVDPTDPEVDPTDPEVDPTDGAHTHSYGEWETLSEASCTEDGLQVRVCSCGDIDYAVIPATGHTNTALHNATAATCTADGYTGDTYCLTCGEMIAQGEVIAALGHDWSNEKVLVEPSCEETGVRVYSCSRCLEVMSEEIPATGHNYSNGYCTNCNAKETEIIGPDYDTLLSGDYGKITLWVSESEGVKEQFESQIAAFQTKYPNIQFTFEINVISEADAATQVITDVASAPDIYCFAQDQLTRLVQSAALSAPSGVLIDSIKALNSSASVSAASVAGTLYAYPMTADNGFYMYYDTSILSEEDVEDLATIVEKVEASGKKIRFALENAWYNAAFFYATGCYSNWSMNDEGKWTGIDDTYNSENGLIAMKGMQILAKSSAYDSDADIFTDAAVIVTGTWNARAAAAHFGENLGATDLPSFTVGEESYHLSSYVGCKLMGVKPQSDVSKQNILHLLAQYLTNEENQLARFNSFGWGPSNLAALADEAVQADISLQALNKQNAYAVPQGNINGSWWDIAKRLGAEAKNATTEQELWDALKSYDDAVRAVLEKSEEELRAWGVIGSICGTNWDTDFPMTEQADGSFLSDVLELHAGEEFKVRQGGSWDVNYGQDGVAGGNNIVVETTGQYRVRLTINGANVTIELVPTWYADIAANGSATAVITTGGQYAYFRFVATKNGQITFYSTGSSDTYGYILDASGNTLRSDDDSGNGTNFSISYQVSAGTTYYLAARFYSSSQTGSFNVYLNVEQFEGRYTYMDWVSNMSTCWNPHTYETSDQSYPMDFISAGLYSFVFNDALHPIDGVEEYEGYVIVPEMAAEKPIDVTEQYKTDAKWGIPEDATEGYAYTIKLNQLATWDDGTPIKAVDYVESMKRLLAPELANYRASSYYTGNLVLVGAEEYYLQGQSVIADNGVTGKYTIADLVKGADGNYTTPEGTKVYIAVGYAIDWCNDYSLKTYVEAYGTKYFGLDRWEELVALMDEDGLAPCNDETLAMLSATTTTNAAWGETDEDLPNYLVYEAVYEAYDFKDVGIFETGEYEFTIVLKQKLTGFYLLYNLSGNWIVKIDVYDACLTEDGGVWYSSYNTSVSTSPSYGPYIIDQYQMDKSMHFTRNENWYGYTDGKHIYIDPEDGKAYPMYQTTDVNCVVVTEVATAKNMFLAGELMAYGLQPDDYAEYGSSPYAHFTPGQATYFIILNGYMEAIQNREAAEGFDQTQYDLETLTLNSFHRALGLCYDKQEYCDQFSPAQSPAFGLIGSAYICDPDTGLKYRDTDQAKKVLLRVYGFDPDSEEFYDIYDDLDEAIDEITGYDPVKAKEYFQQAYNEALDAGYITDNNGDGISDQTIKITYAASAEVSAKMKLIIEWLTQNANDAAEGTGFEGKIVFDISVPLGDQWSTEIKAGTKDVVLGGWTGSSMDPYGLMEVYTNPSYQYDGKWWDAKTVDLTLTIDGEEITMNLYKWQRALCGSDETDSDGNVRNFGDFDQETRIDILAALEEKVLLTYDYLPFTQAGSFSLLSQKAYYLIEDYNPVMGRGGIAYLRYNYNDAEWDQVKGSMSYT